MKYRPLGRTGISVSEQCLGAMMFGSFGNADHDAAVRIIHRAMDAGINFIDTADGYSAGESEEILGKALVARLLVKPMRRASVSSQSSRAIVLKRDLFAQPARASGRTR